MLSRFSDSNFSNDDTLAPRTTVDAGLARWEEEQLFEEDLRAVLNMMRPNRAERMLGWSEYRTGGSGFRSGVGGCSLIGLSPWIGGGGASPGALRPPGRSAGRPGARTTR